MNRFILLICCLVTFTNLNAQLLRGSANGVTKSAYILNGKSDSLFLFNPENLNPFIEGKSPTGDSINFEWSYYYPGVGYSVIASDSAISWKIDTLTSNGGYRLILGNGVSADTHRCWVLFTNFSVAINSDKNDSIVVQTCGFIEKIAAVIDISTSTYYHPIIDNSYTYKVKLIDPPNWTSDKAPEAQDPVYDPNDKYLAKVDEPYWKDTWYKIIVTDETGYIRSDSTFYKSIQPHADFFGDTSAIALTDPLYYPNPNPKNKRYDTLYADIEEVSAPAIFVFKDESVNADSLHWIFGDGVILKRNSYHDSIVHTYDRPGIYKMGMIAYKYTNIEYLPYPCTDTLFMRDKPILINVSEPKLIYGINSIPNVVRHGEYFRLVGDVSIGNIEIAIFNRFGKRVYYYNDNIRDWAGWDCTNKNGEYISTGVYYYVFKEISHYPNIDPILEEEVNLNEIYTNKDANNLYRGFFHYFDEIGN